MGFVRSVGRGESIQVNVGLREGYHQAIFVNRLLDLLGCFTNFTSFYSYVAAFFNAKVDACRGPLGR